MALETIVLISGANQGIGYEITKKLATERKNYHIFLGTRDLAKGQEACKSLQHLPGSVQPITLDITSDDSISRCVESIKESFGRIDVLVNNAGIGSPVLANEKSLRGKLAKCLDTNAFGAACLTEACIPLLQKAKLPRIVFVSSEMGSIANTLDPNFSYYGAINLPYTTSKAAMNMIAAAFAVKYQKEGFKVNVCCPGLRSTNLNPAMGVMGGPPSEGAIEACRLAALDADGESGTFSNLGGKLPW